MTEGTVQVYATADATQGRLMQGRLEAEGIPVMMKGEGDGPYRMGPVYLWVPPEHETAARAIIEAVGSGAFALEDDEPMETQVQAAEEPS